MKKLPLLFDDPPPGQTYVVVPAGNARGLTAVLAIFFFTRLVVWAAAYSGSMLHVRLMHGIDPPFDKHREELALQLQDKQSPIYLSFEYEMINFAPLLNFDGFHYKSIIEGGYEYKPANPDQRPRQPGQNIAFFPLFPMLCMPLAKLLGAGGANVAMVLVVHAASLVAGLVLYYWVRRRIDQRAAVFTVACLFCLPASCYFAFGYAESVTLLLTVITLVLIDRRAWWPAALVCGLATASRPTALGLAAVVALAFLFNAPLRRPKRWALAVALGLVGSAGLLAYAGYLGYRFGSPTVYLTNFRAGWVTNDIRSDWFQFLTFARVWDQFKYLGHVFTDAPLGLIELTRAFTWNMPINLIIIFLSLAGMTRVPRSFRPLLLLGPFIFMHAYIASGGANFGVEPIGRYMAVSVPAFVVLGVWATKEWPPAARTVLIAFMLLIQASWAFQFGMGEWSG